MKAELAFPTLEVVVNSVVFLLGLGVVVVYLLSKALKLRPKPIEIADPGKEMAHVSLVIVAAFVVVSILSGFMLDAIKLVDVIGVLWFVFLYALLLLPMVVAMKKTGETPGSIGISGKNGWRIVILGLGLGAVYSILLGLSAYSYGGSFMGLSPSLAYGLVAFTIGGFGEEIVWRGYIQTRLIAYSGTLKGLVATSLLFALWHFPTCYYASSGAVLESLANALVLRLPGGLLNGYVMLKSQNIISPSILHAAWNLSIFLWQLPTGFN